MKIIDFHVHAGKFDLLRDDIQGLIVRRPFEPGVDAPRVFSDPAALESYLTGQGVSKAVVLAECGPATNYTIDSAMISEMCAGSSMLIPFGSINPNHHDPIREFEHSVNLGVKGFKFYPADHSFPPLSDGMLYVYGGCESVGLPVMFHTGTTAQRDTEQQYIRPSEFEDVARRFPSLVVILAHAGKPNWFHEARDLARRYPNVYLDTALVDTTALSELGIFEDLADKVVFGSDWPVCGSYAALLDKMRAADIGEELLERCLFHNGRALLERVGLA